MDTFPCSKFAKQFLGILSAFVCEMMAYQTALLL